MAKIVKGETRGLPGRWIVDFRDQHGRRHRANFATRKEASAKLDEVREQVRKRTFIAPREVPTFRAAATEWLQADKAKREPATYEYYRGHLEKHLFPRIGELRLDRIDVKLIEQNVRDPLAGEMSAGSVNKVLGTLRNFWRFAKRRGYAHENPAADAMGLPRARRRNGPETVYTPDELAKLIETAPAGRWRTFFTMAMLGLRHGELLGLRWEDFAEDFAAVRIASSLSRARGPGEEKEKQKARTVRLKDPKTETSARVIPLPSQVVSALKRWKLQCPLNELDLVFPDEVGRPMHPSRGNAVLHSIQDAAELKRLPVKALRHSFATCLLEGGEVDVQVARLLGHADTTVTRKVYAHWFNRPEAKGMASFADAVLGKAAAE